MEIEKKGDLDSNWEDIYTLLKNGDWKAAGEFCEKRMRDSYKSPAFLTAVKCVRFWSNAYEEADLAVNKYLHAQKLTAAWGSFAGHFHDQFSAFERGVHLIRRKVFADALLDFLQILHEDTSATEETEIFVPPFWAIPVIISPTLSPALSAWLPAVIAATPTLPLLSSTVKPKLSLCPSTNP